MHLPAAGARDRAAKLDRLTGFVGARLQARDEDGLWLSATLLVGAIAATALLIQGLIDPLRVQNDARQFIFWMARWSDPSLFAGDLLADYWQSVSPWFYRAIFYVLHSIGIGPILAAKFLAAALLPLTGLASYRLTRAIGGDPFAAFLTGACIVVLSGAEDIVVSATPRSLWPALFILVLDGIARRSVVQTALAQVLLAGTYPHMALIAATVIGLSALRWHPRPGIDFSRRRIGLVGAGAIATALGLLPFLLQTEAFGPVATMADIRAIPTFSYGGRGAVLNRAGNLNLACSDRTGFIKFARCSGFASPVFLAALLLVVVGPIGMAWRYARSGGRGGTPIYLYVLAASVLWFVIAALFLFRLHLPSRFAGKMLEFLAVLATAPLLADALRRLWAGRAGRLASVAMLPLLIVGLGSGAALVNGRFIAPESPELVRYLADQPASTLTAGFVRDLDNVPVLAERPVLFSWEHAIAYQLGYFRQIEARMRDMAEVELTPNASTLAGHLTRHAVDTYLVHEHLLRTRQVERTFRGFIGSWIDELRGRLGRSPTALGRLAPACTRTRIDGVLVLDAHCLVRAARG